MFDVAIAGGGLAGSACGAHLAAAGARVIVLERSLEPRRKACGEGLFPRGLRELERLGIASEATSCGATLEGVEFFAGRSNARAAFGYGRAAGLGIRRGIVDTLALEAAKRAGADVWPGATVRSLVIEGRRAAGFRLADGEIVRAKVCIAADGLHSSLRRQAGLAASRHGGRYGLSAHAELTEPAGKTVRVWFERGYELYLTPVGERAANVAILCGRGFMRGFAGNLRDSFEALLRGHPALAGRFRVLDAPLAAGPFEQGCTRAWRANFVLAGDAAGFFDGITGEGMSAALASGRLAAEAALAHLATGEHTPFREYERERRALVRNANLLGKLTLVLGQHPQLAAFVVRNLARRPETFERLLAVSSGEDRLRCLRPRDLLALAGG